MIAKARSLEGLETSVLGPVVLQDIIHILTEQFMKSHASLSIISKMPKDDCVVLANDYLLELLINLIDNGVRYNPHELKRIWIDVVESRGGLEILISDNGMGMTDDMKRTLLNGHRRFGGVGIHQARIIAKRFGAEITVKDRVDGRPDEGITVALWFPQSSCVLTV